MTPTPSKPHELIRKKLAKRTKEQIALTSGVTPKSLLKSPSQKKSERARQKELKRAGVFVALSDADIPCDCHTCPKQPCEKTLSPKENFCGESWVIHRCKGCNARVRYRYDINTPWVFCQICRDYAERYK